MLSFFFFFNDTATTEIYTLSLHDALPISRRGVLELPADHYRPCFRETASATNERTLIAAIVPPGTSVAQDRKSTRLNSSHGYISYAVFCLKKKKKIDSNVNTAIHRDDPAA